MSRDRYDRSISEDLGKSVQTLTRTLSLVEAFIVSTYITVALIAIVIVALLTWALKRNRLNVWQQWARAKDLSYLAPPAGPKIVGQIDGRDVTVEPHAHGSDTEGPVEIVRVTVKLHGIAFAMDVEGAPGLIGDLAQLAEDQIQTGDEEFDRDVIVRATMDAKIHRDFWNSSRRTAFLRLVREAPCDRIFIEHQTLIGEERDVISSVQHLDELANALLVAAKVLDDKEET